jgi:hypothetical protein
MPPGYPPYTDLFNRLQQTLVDTRVEVRRRGTNEWLEHIRAVFPVSKGGVEPTTDAFRPLRTTLEWLRDQYLRSTNEKNRKQGLAMLKELVLNKPAASKLPDDLVRYLVDIQLQLLSDKNEEVRLLALDLQKHIVLQIRASVYLCFPRILGQLIQTLPPYLGNEKDQGLVKQYTAVEELTRSMLNVVHQQLQQAQGAPPFDMDAFIAVIRDALVKHTQNPTVCHFVTTTCLRPFREYEHVFIVQYVHEYLGELLEALNTRTPTADQANAALKETLPTVSAAFQANLQAAAAGTPLQPTADRVKCMEAVLKVMQGRLGLPSAKACLHWMSALTQNADDVAEITLLPLLSRMVRCVVAMGADKDALRQNERLCVLMNKYGSTSEISDTIDFQDLLRFLRESLDTIAVRLTVLNWIALVHKTNPRVCDAMLEELNRDVLKCVSDPSEEVVRKALEVLCCLARSDANRWETFVKQLIDLISEARHQLQQRIPMTIKQLQAQAVAAGFAADFVLCTVACLLSKLADRYFVTTVVTTLSMMLITAPELSPLRHSLKLGVKSSTQCERTFRDLYACWACNSVWALGLCLLAGEYDQAHRIATFMADCDPSAHTLMQLDRLLQLLETPAFTFLRNGLTMPRTHPYLVRTLYTVLMILPQTSPQFKTLQMRLNCAAQLQATLVAQDAPHGPPGEDESGLFRVFLMAQEELAMAEGAQTGVASPAASVSQPLIQSGSSPVM